MTDNLTARRDHAWYVERQPWRGGYSLTMVVTFPDGKRSVCVEGVLRPLELGETPPVSPFVLRESEAQRLMDELWLAGLRPSEGTGSAGALAATQAHLEDMRRLVWEMVVGRPAPTGGQRG